MTVRTRETTWESLDHVVHWAQEDVGTQLWWGTLADALGELGDELARTDIAGLAAQITDDAPHFAASAGRLPALDQQIRRDVARLRLVAATRSGSPSAVCRAVEKVLGQVRTLHRLSGGLMLDAYERDIGGD
jgi:hypothetical protein